MDNIQSSAITDKFLMKMIDDLQRLTAERTRMKIALNTIDKYVDQSSVWTYRTEVIKNLIKSGLHEGQ